MRSFWHINEFAFEAMDVLTFAVLFSDEVVLWAPSASRINEACNHQLKYTNYNSRDILTCVESGAIRIAGRERWLLDKSWRNGQAWDYAHWDDGFDSEVRRIAKEDMGKLSPRVIIASDEDRGYQFADEQLEKAESPAVAAASALVKRGQLPLGTLQRGGRIAGGKVTMAPDRIFIREVIRDAFNHEWARTLIAKADIPIETSDFPPEFSAIGLRKEFDPTPHRVDFDRLIECVQVIGALGDAAHRDGAPPPSLAQLAALSRGENISKEFSALLSVMQAAGSRKYPGAVRDKIVSQLLAAESKMRDPVSYIFGAGLPGHMNACNLAVTVASAATVKLSRRNFVQASASIASLAFSWPTAKAAAEWGGISGLSQYDGPKWPFILRHGVTSPNWEQLSRTIVELRKANIGSIDVHQ